ncbi:MAG: T9SS type A sorting domain-containing protein [Prevotella sp.]|nr:T9SS type A sorting domain-containing protein [Prevotella sp.]
MRKCIFLRLYVIIALAMVTVGAGARQLWLAPGGNGDGTSEQTPMGNPQEAIENLVAGDTLWVLGGVYDDISQMINVRHSGTVNHRICVFGYGEERAVFDFSKQPHTGDDNATQLRGVLMNANANYWYWRDIDFTHAADNGMKLEASYCVIERCNFYRNGDTGLQLGFDKDGNGGNNRNPKYLYCRYNQIINCDSYYNYDVQSHGGNADGFANKLYPGPGNEWHGDRCWGNSDDGWDLYYAAYPCLIDNCWAIYNGYLEDGSIGVNGNGFKQGGNKQGGGSYGAHIFTNCVAAYNLYHGFDQNNHNEGNWIINCTAFSNKQVNFRFNCDVEMVNNTVFHLRNCLGFNPGEANHRFGDMWPDSKYTNWTDILGVSPQYNMGKGKNPETGEEYKRISAKDWPNYDDQFEDIELETALGPRQPNGELPLRFARPKAESIFVDKGMPIEDFYCEDFFKEHYLLSGKWLDDYSTTITLPYAGEAPDYGAFEAGMERPAYKLETLPMNDGTLPDADDLDELNGKVYQKQLLINDYLFQDDQIANEVSQYISDASTANKLLPTYYGKSGKWPTVIGDLYGGATKGAYMLAKSGGYIEFSMPSISEIRSNMYGGGKSSTIKVQWKRPGESGWHDGESFTFDQRVFTADLHAYGVPLTEEPIIVRINSTGSNDVYLTDLTINGYEETNLTPTALDEVKGVNGTGSFQITGTQSGLIVYGDIAELKVFDLSGKQVAQSALSQFVNLSHVGSGIYVVQIKSKSGRTATRKIIRK